jgi:hypothetical protein
MIIDYKIWGRKKHPQLKTNACENVKKSKKKLCKTIKKGPAYTKKVIKHYKTKQRVKKSYLKIT